jgi:hypothetical protein
MEQDGQDGQDGLDKLDELKGLDRAGWDRMDWRG